MFNEYFENIFVKCRMNKKLVECWQHNIIEAKFFSFIFLSASAKSKKTIMAECDKQFKKYNINIIK